MAAHEGGDEHLVLGAEPGQPGQLEGAFDGDVVVGQPHPLDHHGPPLGQLDQLRPILRFRSHPALPILQLRNTDIIDIDNFNSVD